MINYGVVYPQAILMFVITMLYSVVQPLIVIFGAIYFGVGYVVYKYKLLFGEFAYEPFSAFLTSLTQRFQSILQTLRITRPSLAHHLHPPHMGRGHLPAIHDRHLHAAQVVHPLLPPCAAARRHGRVVVVRRQGADAAEQVRGLELGV